jgi:hypothetical protein
VRFGEEKSMPSQRAWALMDAEAHALAKNIPTLALVIEQGKCVVHVSLRRAFSLQIEPNDDLVHKLLAGSSTSSLLHLPPTKKTELQTLCHSVCRPSPSTK